MGLFSRTKFVTDVATSSASGTALLPAIQGPLSGTDRRGLLSPWSEGQLQSFAWSDVFGTGYRPVTRLEAMSLPPVAKGRALIIGELAGKRLVAVDKSGELAEQPPWLYRTDSGSGVTPWHRLSKTYDDWIFYGHALWILQRGTNGRIIDAAHLPYDRWQIDSNGQILVAQQIIDDRGNITVEFRPVDAESILYLPGPFEGLISVAQATIRAAKDLENSWAGKARTPAPMILLQEVNNDGQITQDEAEAYVEKVKIARRDPDGSVMFLPSTINGSFHGDVATDLMIEGRNAARLDIAAFLNLPASALDAALPKASLNYETQAGTEAQTSARLDYWSEPLEARLSADDVVPRGAYIRFDFSLASTNTAPDTGPFAED